MSYHAGTTSIVVIVSDITISTYKLESTLKSIPRFTVNSRSNWVVIGAVCGGVILVMIVLLVVTMVVGLYCYNIKRKQKSAKLNRGMIIISSTLTNYIFTDRESTEASSTN